MTTPMRMSAPSEGRWLSLLEPFLAAPRGGVIVDFDGTISAIASSPDAATIDPTCRRALATLAAALPVVAVVSGRSVDDLRARVGLDGLIYVGSHGGEWWPPTAGPSEPVHRLAGDDLAALQRAVARAVAARLPLDGIVFEPKPAGLAIHFRQAPDPIRAAWAIARAVRSAGVRAHGLTPRWGKCVLELRPVGAPTKGTAVEVLVQRHRLDAVLAIGDDRTDVDAFRALRRLRDRGAVWTLAIAVGGPELPLVVRRWADLVVDGVPAVAALLALLADSLPARARR